MVLVCWHLAKLFCSWLPIAFSFPCNPCLWHTDGHEKRSRFTHLHHACISGKIVTLRLWTVSPAILSCLLRIAERRREWDGVRRKGSGTAVWTITLPHCSMEPCPVNSFHHGRMRRSPRKKKRGQGGGRGGAVEDTSCVAEWVLATPQRRKQPWALWKKWWKMNFPPHANKNCFIVSSTCSYMPPLDTFNASF